MKAFLQKGKKIPEPFLEPFTTALNRCVSWQFFHVVTEEKRGERREEREKKKRRKEGKEERKEGKKRRKEGKKRRREERKGKEEKGKRKRRKERRKGRKKNCFTGSSFECDFFFTEREG